MVNWLVRFPLSLFMPFPAAVAGAMVIGMAVGFYAYRKFVFIGSNRGLSDQLFAFIAVNAVSLRIVTGVSVLMLRGLVTLGAESTFAPAIAHAVGIAAGALSNFYGHKAISFAKV
ncbi:GtrA family protein (plasmid) [Phyllobacterium sp. A18/5-2]|uniref:GtrA family protein n=1 Tax=Phyllobacterium sp. A18/5-2 TaxID=2978392 RepID=UPI0021C932E9|nr:GtrA family protein [Phyllobacterium sp. A18/5-2]UXN66461.1 GtrA family protein [Phyllobacterium sp. A18/5-2]